jgi:biotin-dependent carboxylase-like uncharacterized protein
MTGTAHRPGVSACARPGLQVLAVGSQALIQDLGRPGLAHLGVGESGAADVRSFRLANRLLANPEDAAAIEVVLGDVAVRALDDLTIAVTGAPAPLSVNGRAEPSNAVVRVRGGDVIRLGRAGRGLRTYLAVRGGVHVTPVLGSRSCDVMAGLGPGPLRPGDSLDVGPVPPDFPTVDMAACAPVSDGDLLLHARPGPRDDWFWPAALEALWTSPFVVTPDSDRVGMRLSGPALPRREERELMSEGMVVGSLQAPPSGRLTLFLADHPVTGGYPVIAVVMSRDLHRAAQARPGQRLRFRRA